MDMNQLSTNEYEEVVAWRRHIHQTPELAFEEYETSAFIARQLSSFGIDVSVGLAGTGVVGTLRRGTSRKSIGFRADMDAIPGTEETGLSYASRSPGKMHGCGHDGHVAMLLGAAKSLAAKKDLDGTIQFIFQPAEEVEGGGKRMVDEGLFSKFPVEAVYGIHNWPALAFNHVSAEAGPVMAAFGIFTIDIKGRGAHGGMPHEGADPNAAAFQIGSALQTVVSRNSSPVSSGVISVTTVHGGSAFNVIPETCRLTGTTRWLEEDAGDILERRLHEVAQGVGSALGCEVTIDYQRRYPVTVNDIREAAFVQSVVREGTSNLILAERCKPSMGSEDFAFMLQESPGAYIWLGAKREGKNPPLHAPSFDFNDAIVPAGVDLWRDIAIARLK
ncbi:M20 aminoacylase family protein [Shinella sp. DD12]|uniref:M20 aminoacylase family protein n=1 Tax=Shinella sp. DD12 TaxID=1410620 RepID=UPI0004379338|nr:M20 aminoacylase family protein [Shinella sp. DD12]EYR77611.1 hippurate hydrolase HipO [Shinella sp. DD12]